MTATYTTSIKSNYFSLRGKYFTIKIESNDLDMFVKIVEHCKELENLNEYGMKKND